MVGVVTSDRLPRETYFYVTESLPIEWRHNYPQDSKYEISLPFSVVDNDNTRK